MDKSKFNFWSILIVIVIIYFGSSFILKTINKIINKYENNDEYVYSDNTFSLITTPENKVLEETMKKYLSENGIKVQVVYADNLEIVDKINTGEKYDAIWASNSIWLNMIKNVSTSELKSTSITPVTFGIKKAKAKELGLIGKNVTMKELLELIKSGKLTFSMANPVTTNSGASSYLNILSTLAGNPDVLTSKDLKSIALQNDLKSFFSGLKRTSGDEDFLEKSFINGDYDAAFTYEASIININKELTKQNKDILYAIYPIDGVTISDSPLVYIDNKNDKKKEAFLKLQDFILSGEGQETLLKLGRRTWYGGTTTNAPSDIFNKDWGIDTTKYISPVKYPSDEVIKEALLLYQTKLKKPVHVVFCLDYSGSMSGKGINDLKDAMAYLFSDQANSSMIQFTEEDKIDVIAFGSSVNKPWSAKGNNTKYLLDEINKQSLMGATSLFPAALEAMKILQEENDNYNSSVIIMTDGVGNIGSFSDLEKGYNELKKEIPIYSITFGDASYSQLNDMSSLSNGKVFDGRNSLLDAFKTVRGYN